MSAGASKDYKFGPKNNWRRTMWNEVLRRTAGREKTQPILYMAGRDDLDREVAVSKGVPPQNLIAIDRSRANVLQVRKSGGLAVDAEALEVLFSWPSMRPVCAVLLDFCGGFHWPQGMHIYLLSSRPAFTSSVMMLNMNRGRDASSNKWRNIVKKWFRSPCVTQNGCVYESELHRGMQFLMAGVFYQMLPNRETCRLPTGPDFEVFKEGFDAVWDNHGPWFHSYRSRALVYDSVIYDPLHRALRSMSDWREFMLQQEGMSDQQFQALLKPVNAGVARKIAATMAVRTMRQSL